MSGIIYLPLDERPCNYDFPALMAEGSPVKVIRPPSDLLGCQKKPAARGRLQDWLGENIQKAEILIVSIEMFLYGGLVPSRLHERSLEDCREDLSLLKDIKRKHPELKIFASSLIMRVPAYNSSEEEPDYYAEYGEKIFQMGALQDKIERKSDDQKLQDELAQIKDNIPVEIRKDYLDRRQINHQVNREVVDLVNKEVIDFLVIPMDDNSEYSFSSIERRRLQELIYEQELLDRVFVYPGADEVGCTLTARAYNRINGYRPRICSFYSSEQGKTTIPDLEDRSICETVKYQISAVGGIPVYNPREADTVLMVNPPTANTGGMDHNPQKFRDDPERNLPEFVAQIEYQLKQGRSCAVADVAVVNYPDEALVRLLKKRGLLTELTSYAAWNTSSNSLGTVVAHSCIAAGEQNNRAYRSHSRDFLFQRYLRDWGYQSRVRDKVNDRLTDYGLSYFDLQDKVEMIEDMIAEELTSFREENLPDFDRQFSIKLPWERLFEIAIELGGD